ncbi:LOW QUALITY PROTEIN: 2-hydroxyacyl-CoA lyase 2-like [Anomalospiza imberbis]|uniref:LOW QUALITY PROTEIN: 2-hydroxyacyl-CoA lyase 2-like n=1 Tax=Anomalospiza imberbis TaxID=187417 RepID=UPI00358E7B0B
MGSWWPQVVPGGPGGHPGVPKVPMVPQVVPGGPDGFLVALVVPPVSPRFPWWPQVVPGGPDGFLVAPGGSWWPKQFLVPPGGSWWPQVVPGGPKQFLVAPGGSWWPQVVPGGPGGPPGVPRVPTVAPGGSWWPRWVPGGPRWFLVALVALVALVLLVVAQCLGLLYCLFHKVDTTSPRHGGELVAEVLRAHGVRFLFTLPGGHISPVLVACEKIGIRVVDTRHEATAVFAADAVSRLSGRIGVAAVTAGPGVTNAVTAVKNAQMAESPLLLLAGAAATLQKGRGALQDIPQLPLFRTLCKSAFSVGAVRDIVPTLRRAIAAAMEGTPGPVFVELPIDVLYPFHVVQKELLGSKTPRGCGGNSSSETTPKTDPKHPKYSQKPPQKYPKTPANTNPKHP